MLRRYNIDFINGWGWLFKSITGNLDKNCDEYFETMINNLENNQNILTVNVKKQYSLVFEK